MKASLLYFSDRCLLPKVIGPCRARAPRYYYDKTTGYCHYFVYGGCRGNENRFQTIDECNDSCRGKNDSNTNSNTLSLGIKYNLTKTFVIGTIKSLPWQTEEPPNRGRTTEGSIPKTTKERNEPGNLR